MHGLLEMGTEGRRRRQQVVCCSDQMRLGDWSGKRGRKVKICSHTACFPGLSGLLELENGTKCEQGGVGWEGVRFEGKI